MSGVAESEPHARNSFPEGTQLDVSESYLRHRLLSIDQPGGRGDFNIVASAGLVGARSPEKMAWYSSRGRGVPAQPARSGRNRERPREGREAPSGGRSRA